MKPYFDTTESLMTLNYHAVRWVGTPFVPHGRVRQAGVDCVQLAAELYKECGLLKSFDAGKYAIDAGQHNTLSQVFDWLSKSPQFSRVFTELGDQPKPGDLLVMNVGRVEHHVAIQLCANTFIHALRGRGVVISPVNDSSYARRITAAFRPVIA